MSGEVGYAVLPIIPSLRGVGAEINKQISAPITSAGQTAGRGLGSSLAGGIGTGLKVVGGLVAAVGGTVAAVALKGGISRALNIQDAQASLKGLGHDTNSVTAIMQSALGAVRGTAFGLDQAAGTAAGAVAAGIKPGEALTRTLTLTADAATIAKTSMGEMGSIFNKVATSGKLTTEVVNQLQDRGIPVLQLVADEYGVTAAAASEMVTKGEVDFERFQNAMETGLGGAALASGDTARGALANVQAALSRVGAMFVTPAITGSPKLFQSIAGAIDRGAAALQPYADAFGAKLTPALAAAAVYIDGIDFAKPIAGIQGLYDIVVKGDFTGKLTEAFGWAEDDKPVDFILDMRDGIAAFFATLSSGDPTAAFSSIGSSLTTLAPAFQEFGAQLPEIGQAAATLAAAGLGMLTTGLAFLADHVDVIIAWMPAIVVGFAAWRLASSATMTATLGLRAAEIAAIPAQITRNGLRLAAALLEWQMSRATATSTATTVAQTAATNATAGAQTRSLAATILARGASIAAAAATGIVTAAQWLWNAALSANPIGIVIVLIAALVAAIIWVATQTTFFQDAWSVATTAIGTAVTWLWETVLSPVFAFIGAIFVWIYNTIILPIVTGIVAYFTMWATIVMWLWTTVVSPVFNFIAAIFTWIWTAIIQVIIVAIVLYITMWANIINWLWNSVISPVFNFIGTIFNWIFNSIIMPIVNQIIAGINMWAAIINWLWNNVISPVFAFIGSAFQNMWNGIIAPFIDWVVTGITDFGDTAKRIFEGFASLVGNAFEGALDLARGPLNGMIDLVNGAIGAINGISVEIPSFLPGGGGTVGFDLPTIPRLARGGNVAASRSGTIALLGEAGRAETVTDLGKTNATLDATRALAERTEAGGGADESVHFHGAVQTVDPRELAARIQERRRRARLARGGGRK